MANVIYANSSISNISVVENLANITVTDVDTGDTVNVTSTTSTVTVGATFSNVEVGEFSVVSDDRIRASLSATQPILFSNTTGVISTSLNGGQAITLTNSTGEIKVDYNNANILINDINILDGDGNTSTGFYETKVLPANLRYQDTVLVENANGTASIHNPVQYFRAKNTTGADIPRVSAVYISNTVISVDEIQHEIAICDAGDANTMPCVGITDNVVYSDGDWCNVIVKGQIVATYDYLNSRVGSGLPSSMIVGDSSRAMTYTGGNSDPVPNQNFIKAHGWIPEYNIDVTGPTTPSVFQHRPRIRQKIGQIIAPSFTGLLSIPPADPDNAKFTDDHYREWARNFKKYGILDINIQSPDALIGNSLVDSANIDFFNEGNINIRANPNWYNPHHKKGLSTDFVGIQVGADPDYSRLGGSGLMFQADYDYVSAVPTTSTDNTIITIGAGKTASNGVQYYDFTSNFTYPSDKRMWSLTKLANLSLRWTKDAFSPTNANYEIIANTIIKDNLTVTNNITATNNVTATNFIGDLTGNITTSVLTADYFIGDGSNITGLTTDIVSQGSTNLYYSTANVISDIEGANLEIDASFYKWKPTTSSYMRNEFSSGAGLFTYGNFYAGLNVNNDGYHGLLFKANEYDYNPVGKQPGLIRFSGESPTGNVSGSTLGAFNSTANAILDLSTNNVTVYRNIISNSNITTSGIISAGNSATDTHTFTGNVDVTGNIEVSGNLNYRNVEDLYVRDQSITLNANAATDATVEIIANRPVAGANTVLRWNETSDVWEFTNDGSTYYPIPTSTSDLAEGTNQYYTDARSRAAVSVTQASASGDGTLSYDNGTGVFTYTPPDLTGLGLTNAQVQAFIEADGLTMTSNIVSGSLTIDSSLDGRLHYVREPAATDDEVILKSEAYTTRTNSNEFDFYKGGGSAASPSVIGNNDTVHHSGYWGYDGTQFSSLPNAGYWVFYDRDTDTGIGANNVPLAHEWYVNPTAGSGSFQGSVLKLTPDKRVVFQNTGTRGFGNNRGLASIEADGSIQTQQGLSANNTISTTAGSISGPTLTDTVLSINSGAITSATTGTFSGQVQAGTFTDGSFSVTGGNFTTVGSIGATGNIETNGNITSFSAGGFIGNFNGNGSNISGLTTDIVSEATNLYYTDARSRAAVSVTSNTPSGNGSLSYDNGTGVFTFTPADTSTGAGISNADAKAYIEANGLNATANIETSTFFIGDLDGAVVLDVNNNTGAQLDKGKAVYLTGGNQGDNPNVALADSDDATKMPAIGLVRENISDGSIGQVVTSGVMNFSSHGFTAGADLFISTTAGDLSETAPTGETGLIQKIGKVVSGNHVLVQGAFRTNATPNLDENKIFIGNAANRATTIGLDSLTQNIKTTGNLQVNPDVDVSGLSGLTFDSATNNLGLGTPTPKAAIHIRGTSNESQLFMTEFNGGSSAGIDFRTYRAAGTEATPDFVTNNKRLWTRWHHAYSETGTSDDGIDDGGFDVAFGEQVLTDATHSAGSIPTYWQIYNYRDGDTSNNPSALIKARANGSIEFAMPVGSAFDQDALPAVVIDKDGIYTSNANITTTANVSGNYILGNGSLLTGITGGGSYGDSNVAAFLDSDTMTANIEYTGNLLVGAPAANVTKSVSDVQAYNNGSLTEDSITFSDGQSLPDGTVVTYSGATNGSVTPLNGLVFHLKFNSGDGGRYELFDDAGFTTGSRRVTGGGFYGTGVGQVEYAGVGSSQANVEGPIYANANIEAGGDIVAANASFADVLYPYTNGGTIGFTGARMSDVALGGSSGDDFFWPETGRPNAGSLLIAGNNGAGYWSQGLVLENESLTSPVLANISTSTSNYQGSDTIYRRSRGNISAPTAVLESSGSNPDIITSVKYQGHDGTDYQPSFFSNVFVDGPVSTGNMPLAMEISTWENGDSTKTNSGFGFPIVKFRSDRSIEFNSPNPLNYNNPQGNANITADGSFNTNASIVAQGDITTTNLSVTGTSITTANTTVFTIGTDPDHKLEIQAEHARLKFEADVDSPHLQVYTYRNGTVGGTREYYRSSGSAASPTSIGNNDIVLNEEYFGHDGTSFGSAGRPNANFQVFQDDTVGTSANVVPLSMEWTVNPTGHGGSTFGQSCIKIASNRTLHLQDVNTRGFSGAYDGNVQIVEDGSITTKANVIVGDRLNLKSYTSTEITGLTSNTAGDMVYNSTDNLVAYFDGTNWRNIAQGAIVT